MSSICLNMIVKDEGHVIKGTLDNLLMKIRITSYVISDTGSSDKTKEIIKEFFEGKGIKGEIYEDQWVDFGYNRTLALKYAYNKSDYVLIFDADDRIEGELGELGELGEDSYYLKFGCGVKYKRILLVNNRLEWEYVGVLHEYIRCKNKKEIKTGLIEGEYYIHSGKSGARSNDPDKYKKDAKILEEAYKKAEEENNNIKVRYSFYCAQSHRDSNNKEKAIEWYKKRVELKDWEQEVYFSYLMIGNLYREKQEEEKSIYYWSLGVEADEERYECLYEIIRYYRMNNKYILAYKYYLMIKPCKIDLNDKLFVYYPIYEYLLKEEMIIIYGELKKYKEGIEIYKELLKKILPIEMMIKLVKVYEKYIGKTEYDKELVELYMNKIKELYKMKGNLGYEEVLIINEVINKLEKEYKKINIENIKVGLKSKNEVEVVMTITTCKRYDLFKRTMDSFIINCKDINLIDYFYCVDDNSSKEDRKNMLKDYKFIKYKFKKEEEKGHKKSMNIIWDKLKELGAKYWIHMEDDWLFIKPCNYIGKSIEFLEKYKSKKIHQILYNKNYGEVIGDYNLVGGIKLDENYLLHVKDENNLVGRNSAYWPHYSLRPSMCLVESIIEIGNYECEDTFFERAYADKYHKKGYQSGYYNEITSIHIGKLTNEEGVNAYILNNENQYESVNKIKINNEEYEIINIKKEKNNLNKSATLINKYFKGNNFGSKKSVINNILKHINIWNKIKEMKSNKYIILNEDLSKEDKESIKGEYDILELKKGLKSYIINKRSVIEILKYIENKGIIDSELMRTLLQIGDLKIKEYKGEKILEEEEEEEGSYEMIENNYILIEGKDHYGDDIKYIRDSTINNLMIECEILEKGVCFNTLGFIKNNFNNKTLINYNYPTEGGGLYIRKDYWDSLKEY